MLKFNHDLFDNILESVIFMLLNFKDSSFIKVYIVNGSIKNDILEYNLSIHEKPRRKNEKNTY